MYIPSFYYVPPDYIKANEHRFLPHIQSPPSWELTEIYETTQACRLWKGKTWKDGRIMACVSGRRMTLQDFIYQLDSGPVPRGTYAGCQKNRLCLNSYHVVLMDRSRKKVGMSKSELFYICKRYRDGEMTVKQITERYGLERERIHEMFHEAGRLKLVGPRSGGRKGLVWKRIQVPTEEGK